MIKYLIASFIILSILILVTSECKTDTTVKTKLLKDLTAIVKFFDKIKLHFISSCIIFVVDEYMNGSTVCRAFILAVLSFTPFLRCISLCVMSNSMF